MALNVQGNVDFYLRASKFLQWIPLLCQGFYTPMLGIIMVYHSAISSWTMSREPSFYFAYPSWVLYCGSVLHYQPDSVQRIIPICGLLTHHMLLEPPRFNETCEACTVLGLTHSITHSELAFWAHEGSAWCHIFHPAACVFDMEGTECTQSNVLR